LALTSPTGGGHSVGIVRSRTKATEFSLVYYSWSAVQVSGDIFPHHQEHLTVFTVSGSIHPSCCRLVFWMSWKWFCFSR